MLCGSGNITWANIYSSSFHELEILEEFSVLFFLSYTLMFALIIHTFNYDRFHLGLGGRSPRQKSENKSM